MKKTLLSIALIISSLVACSQMKKPATVKPTVITGKASHDSMVVHYLTYTDTTKIRIIGYADDHSMIWLNAYAITPYRKFSETEKQPSGKTKYCDDKFAQLKESDIQQAIIYTW